MNASERTWTRKQVAYLLAACNAPVRMFADVVDLYLPQNLSRADAAYRAVELLMNAGWSTGRIVSRADSLHPFGVRDVCNEYMLEADKINRVPEIDVGLIGIGNRQPTYLD